jgi:hypothetical protein
MIAIFRSTGKFRSGLTAVRVRSDPGTALLSPNCHLGAVLPSVSKRMTIGRLMLVQAVASAAVLQSSRLVGDIHGDVLAPNTSKV